MPSGTSLLEVITCSFINFDFVVKTFKSAGAYLMLCIIDKSRQAFPLISTKLLG